MTLPPIGTQERLESGVQASGCACSITWIIGLVAVCFYPAGPVTVAGAILAAGAVIADAIALQVRRR